VRYAERPQMQQLMNKLFEHAYIEVHRSYPDIDTIKDILWAHSASIELLHAFPNVLIMDCIYKTNMYRLPGDYWSNKHWCDFFSCFCIFGSGTRSWCLDCLKCPMHGHLMPSIVVTDKDLWMMLREYFLLLVITCIDGI